MLKEIPESKLQKRVETKLGRKAWLRRHPNWGIKDTDKMLQGFFKESGLDPREVYLWILFSPIGAIDKYSKEVLGIS